MKMDDDNKPGKVEKDTPNLLNVVVPDGNGMPPSESSINSIASLGTKHLRDTIIENSQILETRDNSKLNIGEDGSITIGPSTESKFTLSYLTQLREDIDTKAKEKIQKKEADDLDVCSKIITYINYLSDRSTNKPTITNTQANNLLKSIKTEEDRSEANSYLKVYNALLMYMKVLEGVRDKYKREAAILTGQIDVYESYKQIAGLLGNFVTTKHIQLIDKGTLFQYTKGTEELIADGDHIKMIVDGAEISIFKTGRTKVNVDIDNGLYIRMKMQSLNVQKSLSAYKSYLEVLREYIEKGGEAVYLCSPEMSDILDDPDYIPEKNDESKSIYFRFRLNKMKSRLEKVTAKDEKWALYPDYNEIKESAKDRETAENLLQVIIEKWELK